LPEEGYREIEATLWDVPKVVYTKWRVDDRYDRPVLSRRETDDIRVVMS
jgi:hypothetical protein